ncbi:7-deoxyloganetic acid glucosyltransferase [Actinidia chinensis var. chinensis]|uniref:7-deoxyloganetic acid glucosyltransferase n=1 Tax=Actinidia chinensis var. chinensis TaxID=1590841 RepID=A0A2R6RWV4_ACTCC|nr:7-deoxyloganetic acid glucosyltransferase [Actinidia chinensis var. chinensis]
MPFPLPLGLTYPKPDPLLQPRHHHQRPHREKLRETGRGGAGSADHHNDFTGGVIDIDAAMLAATRFDSNGGSVVTIYIGDNGGFLKNSRRLPYQPAPGAVVVLLLVLVPTVAMAMWVKESLSCLFYIIPPRVLIFPYPALSHVGSMLKLAELLCHGGLHVTFLVTHGHLLRHSDVQSRFSRYSGFRLESISDGLPEDDPRLGDKVMDFLHSFGATAKPHFREFLISNRQQNSNPQKPINCIVADGLLSRFATDVAEELCIPIICFRTSSTCNMWVYFCVPKLVQAGELPFKGMLLV